MFRPRSSQGTAVVSQSDWWCARKEWRDTCIHDDMMIPLGTASRVMGKRAHRAGCSWSAMEGTATGAGTVLPARTRFPLTLAASVRGARTTSSTSCRRMMSPVECQTDVHVDKSLGYLRPGNDFHRPFSSTSSFAAADKCTKSPPNAPPPTSSVSAEEVAHFDTLASTWWDADLNPLIGMNPIRVSFIVQTLRTAGGGMIGDIGSDSSPATSSSFASHSPHLPLHGLRALDVGCGGGLLSESLARLGADVTAVDPSIHVATAARQHSLHHPLTRKIDYRGGTSCEDLARELTAIENGSEVASANANTAHLFDLVCVLEVVEHAADPQHLLDSACRLLRPGGLLFISTLNRTAKSYILAIAGAEHVMRMVPVGTHKWEKFLSPAEVGGMITSSDEGKMKVLDVCGMVLKPPFVNMTWTLDGNDTDVNWIGAYRKEKSPDG